MMDFQPVKSTNLFPPSEVSAGGAEGLSGGALETVEGKWMEVWFIRVIPPGYD